MALIGLTDIALLVIRIALGIVFIYHGFPKLLKAQVMAQGMGKPTGFILVLGLVETLSSLSVIVGLLTEIGAIGLGVVMVGALYYKIAVWKIPFGAMDKTGWELDFVLLAAALTLFFSGAGSISLDALLRIW